MRRSFFLNPERGDGIPPRTWMMVFGFRSTWLPPVTKQIGRDPSLCSGFQKETSIPAMVALSAIYCLCRSGCNTYHQFSSHVPLLTLALRFGHLFKGKDVLDDGAQLAYLDERIDLLQVASA